MTTDPWQKPFAEWTVADGLAAWHNEDICQRDAHGCACPCHWPMQAVTAERERVERLDGERLYRTYWRVQWANPGVVGYKPARQWEQLQPEEQRIWHDTAAALSGGTER